MLDVLCCGLGGMILLMLLNMWDARRHSTALVAAKERVGATSKELDETLASLKTATDERDRARALASSTEDARGRTEVQLRAKETEANQTMTQLKASELNAATLRERLVAALRDVQDREKALRAKEAERARAAGELAMTEKELNEQKRLLLAALDKLGLTEEQKAAAEKMAGKVPLLQKELDAATKRALALDTELALLKKNADAAGLKLADAQKAEQTVMVEVATLRKLLDEQKAAAGKLRTQLTTAENRFAGVDLGGKRVVLLIDMSGSMGSVDGQTLDPTKWLGVRQTVVQVLKSLSDVEWFQVILFSTQTRYLLGKPGEWLSYDRTRSPDEVDRAMAQVTPQGDTNMYAAFEAAFQFRPQGLETIFFFSDGLPNTGPGLPANPPTDEGAREALYGKHVRDTIRNRWNSQPKKVKIHAVGFFYESPNLGAFLWALSRENGGSFVGMSRP
jgi:hypothetical protein